MEVPRIGWHPVALHLSPTGSRRLPSAKTPQITAEDTFPTKPLRIEKICLQGHCRTKTTLSFERPHKRRRYFRAHPIKSYFGIRFRRTKTGSSLSNLFLINTKFKSTQTYICDSVENWNQTTFSVGANFILDVQTKSYPIIYSILKGFAWKYPSPLSWSLWPCMEHVLETPFEFNDSKVRATDPARYLYSFHEASHNELARITRSSNELEPKYLEIK